MVNNFTFRVIVVGGPCGQYIDKCLMSLEMQEYKNWTAAVVLDDYDDAPKKALNYVSDKIVVEAVPGTKHGALANIKRSIELQKPDPNDVLVTLDGDDWMNGNNVLGKVARYYEVFQDLWITYGSWVGYPNPNAVNNSAPYHRHEFDNGLLRKGPWRGSHLRTFKYHLWQRVRDEDLRDAEGNYYDCAWDLAFMWPMLEMAGPDRSKWIPDALYVYNRETPHNDEKLRSARQTAFMREIAAKAPYARLP